MIWNFLKKKENFETVHRTERNKHQLRKTIVRANNSGVIQHTTVVLWFYRQASQLKGLGMGIGEEEAGFPDGDQARICTA